MDEQQGHSSLSQWMNFHCPCWKIDPSHPVCRNHFTDWGVIGHRLSNLLDSSYLKGSLKASISSWNGWKHGWGEACLQKFSGIS